MDYFLFQLGLVHLLPPNLYPDARPRNQSARPVLRVAGYLLFRRSWRRECPAPMTAPLAAFPVVAAPSAAPAAAPFALGWELWFC